jgi:DNA-binding SARP family transcriptional activator
LIARAYKKIVEGESDKALDDIAQAFFILKEQEYQNFFTWTPHIVRRVLETAVSNNIELAFARRLARDRLDIAIQDDGTSIPLLRVSTLGGLTLRLGETVIASEKDFTQYQRTMLALLLVSKDFQINQTDIQLALWPEATAEKARTNLDTLLSRFRKTLTSRLGGIPLHNYFQLTKGILELDNCRADHLMFYEHATRGLELATQNALWQAGNAFRTARAFWKGSFMPMISGPYSVEDYRESLSALFIKLANNWCSILEYQGQAAEAEEVLYTAHQLNPCHDDTVRALYRLRMNQGKTGQAIDILNKYRKNLEREEYAEQDIERIVATIRM